MGKSLSGTYSRWTDPKNEKRLAIAVEKSTSIAGVCKFLGLRPVGGNYHNIKFHIARLNLDTSHHLGQGWNKNNFKDRDYSNNKSWKEYLIRQRGHFCEQCRYGEWNGYLIPLELEHADGNRYNFEETNLKLLCCNCHAQTKTWRRRK